MRPKWKYIGGPGPLPALPVPPGYHASLKLLGNLKTR